MSFVCDRKIHWILLVLFFCSCSASVRNRKVYISDLSPKPANYPMKIYYDEAHRPSCPYEVIATLQVDQVRLLGSREDVWTTFKNEARELGGDAIIVLGQRLFGLSTDSEKDMDLQVIGSVIRFTFGSDCAKKLMIASEIGNVDSVRILLDKGISVNVKGSSGSTPLMIAAKAGHTEVVEFLITNGADVNATNLKGSTALMEAAKAGNEEIARLLIHNAADFRLKDKKGWTALSYANENGHTQIVNIIEQQVAEFKRDQEIHTIEAYQDFLKAFPNSIFAEEAHKQIDTMRFEQVQKIHTIEAYENFIERFPNNIYAQKAREAVERQSFEQVEKINTIEAYEGFLKQYPNSKHAKEARLNIEKLRLRQLLRRKSNDSN